MPVFLRRRGPALRPAAFIFLLLFFVSGLPGGRANASENGAEITEVRAVVELFLRSFTEEALLYVERDQRAGTVASPDVLIPPEAETQVFQLNGKDVSLAEMRENIAFIEKKADYCAGMRQLQNIYRGDLQLDYTFQEMDFTGDACRVKVTEAAGFWYLDSGRPSVNEAIYWIDLVKWNGQWLVAAATDGSQFDRTYSKLGGAFDVDAALNALSVSLQQENCQVMFPQTDGGWGTIPYNGVNAAAYAYTYSRLTAGARKPEYYNPRFVNYAGKGGDCMNFASQCMWAGFGGSETASAISGHALPMDASGADQWFGRYAERDKINTSWISCQAFRQYLTGRSDAAGTGGANGSSEPGMYATVLDIAAGSPVTGVEPPELVGAAAQVEGGSGAYGHAIVITAADGLRRDQIYFCGHTKNVTHVKLGDCYLGELKIYIPRYFRVGASQANCIMPLRLPPVEVGSIGLLGAQAGGPQAQMWLAVTSPDGETMQFAPVEDVDRCEAEYIFPQAGLYRVDCYAQSVPGGGVSSVTFYVRCYDPALLSTPPEIPVEQDEAAPFDAPVSLESPDDIE